MFKAFVSVKRYLVNLISKKVQQALNNYHHYSATVYIGFATLGRPRRL